MLKYLESVLPNPAGAESDRARENDGNQAKR
jgi:hypothetical protein